ncbi:MAG: hypothetical protein ABFS10_00915 [Bacteroidota bacterium]
MKKYIFLITLSSFVIGGMAQETFQSHCELGQMEVDRQNYHGALKHYDKALEAGSDDTLSVIWAAMVSSMCAIHVGDELLAMKYNNIAIDYGSEDLFMIDQQLQLAKQHQDPETTERVLLAVKSIEGAEEKYTTMLLRFYYSSKQYTETIELAEEILSHDPDHISSMYYKGMGLLRTGKEDEALQAFFDILKREPDHEKVNMQVGFIYYYRAGALYKKVNDNYSEIEKPTKQDYARYREGLQKSIKDYDTSIPYLEKYHGKSYQEDVTDALAKAKRRSEYLK